MRANIRPDLYTLSSVLTHCWTQLIGYVNATTVAAPTTATTVMAYRPQLESDRKAEMMKVVDLLTWSMEMFQQLLLVNVNGGGAGSSSSSSSSCNQKTHSQSLASASASGTGVMIAYSLMVSHAHHRSLNIGSIYNTLIHLPLPTKAFINPSPPPLPPTNTKTLITYQPFLPPHFCLDQMPGGSCWRRWSLSPHTPASGA